MNRVITIDGPCGAGKSTVAKEVAIRLGFDYLDSGALYRAVALKLSRCGLDGSARDEQISAVLGYSLIEYRHGRVYLDSADVSELIRGQNIGHLTSVFSAYGVVRAYLMETQRSAAYTSDIVAEGRDMGTVVFPEAWKKFFLTSSVENRAKRRYNQLLDTASQMTWQEAMDDVKERDMRDENRQVAPLTIPKDAILIDSSALSLSETIEEFLKAIRYELKTAQML